MADQLNDWKDYLRLKIFDRGNDFALLRDCQSPIKQQVLSGCQPQMCKSLARAGMEFRRTKWQSERKTLQRRVPSWSAS